MPHLLIQFFECIVIIDKTHVHGRKRTGLKKMREAQDAADRAYAECNDSSLILVYVRKAEELQNEVDTPTVVKNPYAPCRTAWEFEYCPTLMYSIRDIYKQIGADLPQSYRDILDRIDGVRK